MRIEVRGQNVDLWPALGPYAERRLENALDRFARRVAQVTVRLVDENGPRGGVDKRCVIEVSIPRARPMVIEDKQQDLYAAIDGAVDRAARVVAREIGRRRAKRVQAAEARAAEKTGISRRPSAVQG